MDQRHSKQPIDPLGETVSDGEAPRPRRVKLDELQKFQPREEPPDLEFGRDLLDDTVSELDAAVPSEEDVQLDRILDRPQLVNQDASLHRYDPEAGRTNVAIKIKAVRQAVANTIATPFGKLVISIPVFLIGVSLVIAAVTFQHWGWIVAAALVFPIGGFLLYTRYQIWLGHKRYLYRLLETLGEDVSDFDYQKRYRHVRGK